MKKEKMIKPQNKLCAQPYRIYAYDFHGTMYFCFDYDGGAFHVSKFHKALNIIKVIDYFGDKVVTQKLHTVRWDAVVFKDKDFDLDSYVVEYDLIDEQWWRK